MHRRGRRRDRCGFRLAVDPGEHRAYRNALPDRHCEFGHDAIVEDLDLDRALLRFHHRHDIAALHVIAGLHQPFDQRAGFHVGT